MTTINKVSVFVAITKASESDNKIDYKIISKMISIEIEKEIECGCSSKCYEANDMEAYTIEKYIKNN